MVSHGGRPVDEGARGIVWTSTLPCNGPSRGFFTMVDPNFGNRCNKQITKEQNGVFLKPMIFENGEIMVVGFAEQYSYYSQ